MATQADCARLIGISERRFRELLDEGVLQRRPAGQYEFDVVVPTYCAHLREIAAGRGGQDAQAKRAVDDARRAKVLADRAEVEFAQLKGELVPTDQIADAVHAAVQIFRTRMLALPSSLSARIGARDPGEAEKMIREQVIEALEDLAKIKVTQAAPNNEGTDTT